MFQLDFILKDRSHLGIFWTAAHSPQFLKRRDFIKANVIEGCDKTLKLAHETLQEPATPLDVPLLPKLSLRTEGFLLSGLNRVYFRKADILEKSCYSLLRKLLGPGDPLAHEDGDVETSDDSDDDSDDSEEEDTSEDITFKNLCKQIPFHEYDIPIVVRPQVLEAPESPRQMVEEPEEIPFIPAEHEESPSTHKELEGGTPKAPPVRSDEEQSPFKLPEVPPSSGRARRRRPILTEKSISYDEIRRNILEQFRSSPMLSRVQLNIFHERRLRMQELRQITGDDTAVGRKRINVPDWRRFIDIWRTKYRRIPGIHPEDLELEDGLEQIQPLSTLDVPVPGAPSPSYSPTLPSPTRGSPSPSTPPGPLPPLPRTPPRGPPFSPPEEPPPGRSRSPRPSPPNTPPPRRPRVPPTRRHRSPRVPSPSRRRRSPPVSPPPGSPRITPFSRPLWSPPRFHPMVSPPKSSPAMAEPKPDIQQQEHFESPPSRSPMLSPITEARWSASRWPPIMSPPISSPVLPEADIPQQEMWLSPPSRRTLISPFATLRWSPPTGDPVLPHFQPGKPRFSPTTVDDDEDQKAAEASPQKRSPQLLGSPAPSVQSDTSTMSSSVGDCRATGFSITSSLFSEPLSPAKAYRNVAVIRTVSSITRTVANIGETSLEEHCPVDTKRRNVAGTFLQILQMHSARKINIRQDSDTGHLKIFALTDDVESY